MVKLQIKELVHGLGCYIPIKIHVVFATFFGGPFEERQPVKAFYTRKMAIQYLQNLHQSVGNPEFKRMEPKIHTRVLVGSSFDIKYYKIRSRGYSSLIELLLEDVEEIKKNGNLKISIKVLMIIRRKNSVILLNPESQPSIRAILFFNDYSVEKYIENYRNKEGILSYDTIKVKDMEISINPSI